MHTPNNMRLPSDQITDEDVSLQQALAASLQDTAIAKEDDQVSNQPSLTKKASSTLDKDSAEDQAKQSPSRYTIDDCIRDININAIQTSRINDASGDTYLYMDPPARQPRQSEQHYASYCQQYNKPFVMQSEKLARVSSLFKEMLGPTSQFRTLRRRKLAGSLPSEIKYVLDITPPSEGEDAVYLTASLCCSEGVRSWYLAGSTLDVSDQLIAGKDDWLETASESLADVPEYSPIRHRATIEQCLAAIQGNNLTIDSAVKVWSIAILIEYFGISSHECTFLTDSLVTWLRAEPNNLFLEVNCEESLRIGAILQNQSITRDVFALLVGEETLDSLVRQRKGTRRSVYSVSGRKKEYLPESWMERVEYATKSFLQCHTAHIENFFANDLEWIDKLLWFHIPKDVCRDAELDRLYLRLKQALKNYIQIVLFACLFDNSERFWGRPQPSFGRSPSEEAASQPYSTLSPLERTLTRNFWEKLREEFPTRDITYAKALWSSIPQEFLSDPLVQKVSLLPHQAYQDASLRAIEGIIVDGQYHLASLDAKNLDPTLTTDEREPESTWTFQEWLNRFASTATTSNGSAIQPALRTEDTDSGWSVSRNVLDLPAPADTEQECSDDHPLLEPSFSERVRSIRQSVDKSEDKSEHTKSEEDDDDHDEWLEIPPRSGSKVQNTPFLKGRLFFNLEYFWRVVNHHVSQYSSKKLVVPDLDLRHDGLNPRLTKTLLNLGEDQWKYLPLWADGLDDGTGAIYSEDVMEAAPGSDFSTPGPSIHTGDSTYSSSSRGGGSDYDMMSDAGSCDTSVNLSTAVADGHSDQMFRGKVYTPSSSGTLDSTDRELGAHAEQERARLVVRSLERAQAIKIEEQEEESVSGDDGGLPEEDACYDDLFSGQDMDEDGYTSDATEKGGDGMDGSSDDDHDDEHEKGVLI